MGRPGHVVRSKTARGAVRLGLFQGEERELMRRLIATTTLLALAASGGLVGSTGADAASSTQTAGKVPTPFAFKAYAFGSRVHGGQVPAGSGSTAFQVIGCTNDAGVEKSNKLTSEDLPGLGKAYQVTTHAWTTRNATTGGVASHSRNAIAKLVLSSTQAGTLSLEGIKSTAVASHDDKGFHADTTAELAKIVLTPAMGPAQEIPVPDPGQSVDVPGVATIDMGTPKKAAGKDLARARVEALTITSAATGSKVHIAQSFAQLASGIKSGLFGGYADGARPQDARAPRHHEHRHDHGERAGVHLPRQRPPRDRWRREAGAQHRQEH